MRQVSINGRDYVLLEDVRKFFEDHTIAPFEALLSYNPENYGANGEEEEEDQNMYPPPVDRKNVTLTTGKPVSSDHREIEPETGMQKDYVVLSKEERAKGYVRPVRDAYTHVACGTSTRIGKSIAETYARDPNFYSGTYCWYCRTHFDLKNKIGEFNFRWDADGSGVGS